MERLFAEKSYGQQTNFLFSTHRKTITLTYVFLLHQMLSMQITCCLAYIKLLASERAPVYANVYCIIGAEEVPAQADIYVFYAHFFFVLLDRVYSTVSNPNYSSGCPLEIRFYCISQSENGDVYSWTWNQDENWVYWRLERFSASVRWIYWKKLPRNKNVFTYNISLIRKYCSPTKLHCSCESSVELKSHSSTKIRVDNSASSKFS